jgi:DNA polymerase-1
MKLLGFDTETYLINGNDKAPKVVVCSWFDGEKGWLSYPDDIATYAMWSDPSNYFVLVNAPYDLVALMRWHPVLIPHIVRALDEGRIFDCAIRHSLMYLAAVGAKGYDPRPSLAKMAMEYLKLDLSASKQGEDIWRLKYGTLDGVPLENWPTEARAYALDDAKHTWQIFHAQGGLGNMQPTECVQVASATVLHGVGVWGFGVNQATRLKLKESIQAKIQAGEAKVGHLGWIGKGSQPKIQAAVHAAWDRKYASIIAGFAAEKGFGVSDPVQWAHQAVALTGDAKADSKRGSIRTLLMEACDAGEKPAFLGFQGDWVSCVREMLKRMPESASTTRGLQCDEDALTTLKDFLPEGKDYLDLKHQQKMMETYVEAYPDATSHPSFVNLVSTGRTGCRTPNNQNCPRGEGIRNMFLARDGRELGTVDYSQLELCTLGASIRTMFPGITATQADAIDANVDVHAHTGVEVSKLLGTPMTYEYIDANKKKDPKAKEVRQGSKACNFGYPGGLGPNTMVEYAQSNYGVAFSFQQAKGAKAAWEAKWPEMRVYLRSVAALVEGSANGLCDSYTISGRKKAGCVYTQAANYRFQGLAADGAKAALWAIWREILLGWYWSYYDRITDFGYGVEHRDGILKDSRIVNFVHDEIVAEHKTGDKAALKRQEDLMVYAMTKMCQDKITIRVEGGLSSQWEH